MILFLAFSAIHVGFIVWAWYYWEHIPQASQKPGQIVSFSIIIPVRNEAENIGVLLDDLRKQSYPKASYEIIVVDDGSEDETVQKVKLAMRSGQPSIRLFQLAESGRQGKKAAVAHGVTNSRNTHILTTDGDCRVGPEWLGSYNRIYHQYEPVMITGPVKMTGSSFFQRIQRYEFSALIGTGAGSLQAGHPGMCNGANLSYSREAFLDVKGYEGNETIPSGDDEFLLQKLFRKFPGRVLFNKSQEAVVSTPAKQTFLELVQQRIRWSSKWRFHQSGFIRGSAILVFLDYLSVVFGAALLITHPPYTLWYGLLFFTRWFALYLFNRSVTRFLSSGNFFWASLAGEIIYPFFVIFLGLASIFGKYSWKGRHYP